MNSIPGTVTEYDPKPLYGENAVEKAHQDGQADERAATEAMARELGEKDA